MSSPYVGEIRLFAGTFNPLGWAICDGAQIAISQNEVLFTLIGTTYGGDGNNYFQLPDFRGRVPVHTGNGFQQGQRGGAETVILNVSQIPAHTHQLIVSSGTANTSTPANNLIANTVSPLTPYGTDPPQTSLTPASIGAGGGGQAHSNMQPFLVMTYIISLYGNFPRQ